MDKLSSTFNVNPVLNNFVPTVRDDSVSTINTDAQDARSNLKDILELGSEALQDALRLAKASENPKAFDAVANLITTLADLNSRIMSTHATEQRLSVAEGIKTAVQTNNTTNNIVFSGTTAELSKLLTNPPAV
jgi:hypothetical protein